MTSVLMNILKPFGEGLVVRYRYRGQLPMVQICCNSSAQELSRGIEFEVIVRLKAK